VGYWSDPFEASDPSVLLLKKMFFEIKKWDGLDKRTHTVNVKRVY
jgi:hypothetical protein